MEEDLLTSSHLFGCLDMRTSPPLGGETLKNDLRTTTVRWRGNTTLADRSLAPLVGGLSRPVSKPKKILQRGSALSHTRYAPPGGAPRAGARAVTAGGAEEWKGGHDECLV